MFERVLILLLRILLLVIVVLLTSQYNNYNSSRYTNKNYDSSRYTNNNYDPPRFLAVEDIIPNSAPFMVSIQKQQNPSTKLGIHHCGGVIINENWVLTAAHCLPSEDEAKRLVLVAGGHNIKINEETTQIRKIDFYENHSLYNGGTTPYDLALIYTKVKFDLNKNVQVISLPMENSYPIAKGTLFGWGNISMTENPLYPDKLHSVDLPIIQRNACQHALGSMGIYVHDTNLCTGPLTGGKGICDGDSGGPFVQRDENSKKDNLIGIVSWGESPCGQPNSPSVFVRVSAFIEWIKNVQNKLNKI